MDQHSKMWLAYGLGLVVGFIAMFLIAALGVSMLGAFLMGFVLMVVGLLGLAAINRIG